MRANALPLAPDTISLENKVAFLSDAGAYRHPAHNFARRETHMSWVFLAGEKVYKLKKPVRFPYLDFSTLARREAACRAELTLNRRLAPDVYEAVVPLTRSLGGFAIDGPGEIVDWLVVMRRLDENRTLEHALTTHELTTWQLDRLISTLVAFYRRTHPVFMSPDVFLSNWHLSLSYNQRILLDPRLALPAGLVRTVTHAQRRFLEQNTAIVRSRMRDRRIVDGHGDLRPEHIWLGDPVRIIDCLEFNPHLRAVDPFDETAFLCVECDRLDGGWAGKYIRRRALHVLQERIPDELFVFYRCHRATLRARLAIAHLLEPNPRTPEKWPKLARTYLNLAAADAIRLERALRA